VSEFDLPLSVQVLFFLFLFLLVGIYPAWKRTAAKIRKLLKRAEKGEGGSLGEAEIESSIGQPLSSPLNDFEIMVLRRLAQTGDRGLTRKQLDGALFLGKKRVNKSLQTLIQRGLVYLAISPLLRFHVFLSAPGRAYAIEQEFIPRIREGKVPF
jgi:hypothetical protein